jgi:hypothetical protein
MSKKPTPEYIEGTFLYKGWTCKFSNSEACAYKGALKITSANHKSADEAISACYRLVDEIEEVQW